MVNYLMGFKAFRLKGSLIHCTLDCLFLLGSFDNPLFDCSFGYQPINIDIAPLANSMGTICSLCIHSWIPIIIIEYDCVGGCEGNTQPTCSSTQQEGEYFRVGLELVHHVTTICYV
jgi:hypothetical protein